MATTGLPSTKEDGETLRGFAFALAAYVMWRFLPIFMKA
jgi:EamA domain-containing membrane protein RarD